MSGAVLSVLNILFHLILPTTQRGKQIITSHFTDEETKA